MTALARAQRLNYLWRIAVVVGDLTSAEALLHAMASLVLTLPEADFRAYLTWCDSLVAPSTAIPVSSDPTRVARSDAS